MNGPVASIEKAQRKRKHAQSIDQIDSHSGYRHLKEQIRHSAAQERQNQAQGL
jgi:hypothetical protein